MENPFDLIWVTAFVFGCIALPIVGGLLAVLGDRE
jgi:hypothetical protein